MCWILITNGTYAGNELVKKQRWYIAWQLKDKDPKVRGYAIYKLIMLYEEECARNVAGNREAMRALGAKEYAKDIVPLLKDEDAGVRDSAVWAFEGRLDAKEYVKDIASLLKDNDAGVRIRAIGLLGLLEAKEYVDDIAKLLKDEDGIHLGGCAKQGHDLTVKGNAALALGRLGAKRYAKNIAELLNDKDIWVRGSSIEALITLDAREYVENIEEKLKSEGGILIRGMLESFWRYNKECGKYLVVLLNDKNDWVREKTAEAFKFWGYKLEKQSDGTYKVIEKLQEK